MHDHLLGGTIITASIQLKNTLNFRYAFPYACPNSSLNWPQNALWKNIYNKVPYLHVHILQVLPPRPTDLPLPPRHRHPQPKRPQPTCLDRKNPSDFPGELDPAS